MTQQIEDKALPTPFFVLRGHASEVQCLHFPGPAFSEAHSLQEDCLISGDSDGYVILWSMATFRPLAIWKAHNRALLTVETLGKQVLSHGRDDKVYLWEIVDLKLMGKTLPLPPSSEPANVGHERYAKPFLLSSLDVNSMNFCQVSTCENHYNSKGTTRTEILLAVPGLVGSEYIDIFSASTSYRMATRIIVPDPGKGKMGNVMALDFQYPILAAAYENGGAAVFRINVDHVERTTQKQDGKWECIRSWNAHREAALSIVLKRSTFEVFTCGIDSRLVRYSFAEGDTAFRVLETRHSGQQSMQLRADGKLLGTAGWDSFARIYATAKFRQVAVLGYHKVGINALAFKSKEKKSDEPGLVALGSKDNKISLWHIY